CASGFASNFFCSECSSLTFKNLTYVFMAAIIIWIYLHLYGEQCSILPLVLFFIARNKSMPKMYGWVREVVPESPADRAGLQPGDLIRTINGQTIRDLVDYRFYV